MLMFHSTQLPEQIKIKQHVIYTYHQIHYLSAASFHPIFLISHYVQYDLPTTFTSPPHAHNSPPHSTTIHFFLSPAILHYPPVFFAPPSTLSVPHSLIPDPLSFLPHLFVSFFLTYKLPSLLLCLLHQCVSSSLPLWWFLLKVIFIPSLPHSRAESEMENRKWTKEVQQCKKRNLAAMQSHVFPFSGCWDTWKWFFFTIKVLVFYWVTKEESINAVNMFPSPTVTICVIIYSQTLLLRLQLSLRYKPKCENCWLERNALPSLLQIEQRDEWDEWVKKKQMWTL